MPPHSSTLSNVSHLFYNSSSLICPSLCILCHLFSILVSILSGLVHSWSSSVHLSGPMSFVGEETNAGVAVFIAEITSIFGIRCDGIAAV